MDGIGAAAGSLACVHNSGVSTRQEVAEGIVGRADLVGVSVATELARALASYVMLLAAWNRTINLTALDVATPSDEAIDRLVVEPLVAAQRFQPPDEFIMDIGSGGGSPGIPLKLASNATRLVLVESKIRKAAFLREAIGHLGLTGVEVANHRSEELLARPDLLERVDLVSVRAVRVDRRLLRDVRSFLRPGGRLFCFRQDGEGLELPAGSGFSVESTGVLVPSLRSGLTVLQRE